MSESKLVSGGTRSRKIRVLLLVFRVAISGPLQIGIIFLLARLGLV